MKTASHVAHANSESSTASSNPSLVQTSLLQRKCACGGSAGAGGECESCTKNKSLGMQTKLRINEPGDAHEQEADRLADAVVRGGPVSLSASQPSLSVQRKDPGAIAAPKAEETSEEDKYKEAAKKIGEAFLETEQGKALKDGALKVGEKFVETVEGKVIAGTALGGALTAIIASNSELPVPIPEIPLDFISKGLKAKITYEGPVQKPTNVSLVLTTAGGVSAGGYYKYAEAADGKPEDYQAGLSLSIPLGPTAPTKPGPSEKEKFRSKTARMAEDQRKFRESMKTPQQRAEEKDFVMNYVLSQQRGTLPGTLPGLRPLPGDWDPSKDQAKKKKKDTPVQRKATGNNTATSNVSSTAPGVVHDVVQSTGQPLDATNRSFMESRFGHDFGNVRIHADSRAGESARSVNALAYTVGNHVVFDPGAYSPQSTEGRRLLAHELTHVVQQSGGSPKSVQRQKNADISSASSVPARKLPDHKSTAPRMRRVDAVDADGFPVTENFCGCEDTVDIMEERVKRSVDSFKSCYKPGMLVNRLYDCARQRLYTPSVGAKQASTVPSAAHTSSSSGAVTWPENAEVKTRMAALGHRTPCWPLVFQSVYRHEKQHVADFDAVAKDINPEFFESFKKLEGDEDRLEKLQAEGFKKETAQYEAQAVNTFTMGPAKALRFELNAYDVELRFITKLRSALSQVCRKKTPPPPQPDVPRPEVEHPKQPPLWPTILENRIDSDSGPASGVEMQRKSASNEEMYARPDTAPPIVNEVLSKQGAALDARVRAEMESRFGHDFGGVRIHQNGRAAESAQAVHASAYTVGSDIVFDDGKYSPQSTEGRRLLAHELTHVIQQSGGNGKASGTQIEAEAVRNADRVLTGGTTSVRSGAGPGELHRAPADDNKEIDSILAAAAKARSAKSKTDIMIHSSKVIYEMIARYLPTYGGRVSGGDYDAAVKRLDVKGSADGKNIAITVGKDFIGDVTDARALRPLAAELEKALAGTGVKPLPEEEPEVGSVATAATPVQGVRTKGITFKRDDLKAVAAENYWEAKVGKVYFMIHGQTAGKRFSADTEEHDAVFSVLWNVRPKKLTAPVTKLINIPSHDKSAAGAKTAPLSYRFTFKPAAKDTANMPSVEFEFVAEGAATTATTAPAPAKGYTPPALGLTHIGFPGADMDKYWAAHPDEHGQLYNWIENLASDPFDQIVTTSTGKPAQTTTFKVKGTKQLGNVSGLKIQFVGRVAHQSEAAPADYRAKTDVGDLALEAQQDKAKDKLGRVKVPRDISTAEAAEVKFLVAAYFKDGTRNAEVDVLVPALDTGGEVMYTFRFLPGNDVETVRVGEPKKGTRLDRDRLDAGRSPEFLSLYKAKDVTGLAAHIKKRYPGAAISGKTVADLRLVLNKEITAHAGDVSWFKDNYDLSILDSTDAETRLKDKHSFATRQTADMKDFAGDELRQLEATLETISLAVLARLKGVRLFRQTIAIEKDGRTFKKVKTRTGRTLTNGSNTTVILFDQAAVNADTLFTGGRLGALSTPSLTFAHEFGHVAGDQDDIQKEFNKFVTAKKINPVTSYAGSDASKEFFPEAFALFSTDPEWMKSNQPMLFTWFETLSTTGKPPKP